MDNHACYELTEEKLNYVLASLVINTNLKCLKFLQLIKVTWKCPSPSFCYCNLYGFSIIISFISWMSHQLKY